MKKKMALALSLAMAATTLAPAAVSAADEQTMIWMHRLPQWQLLMIFRMHSI